jgi:hypothetical protein
MFALRRFRRLTAAAALSAALAATPSQAGVRLELGGDWTYYYYGGALEVMLGVYGPLARNIQIGGRFGGLFAAYGTVFGGYGSFGAPIDLELRANVGEGRVYLGGLVGPWLMFDGGFPLRLHGAFEFGLNAGGLSFGLELGYLTYSPIAGLRLSFRI